MPTSRAMICRALALALVVATAGGCSSGGSPEETDRPTATPTDPAPARTVKPGQTGPLLKGDMSVSGWVDGDGPIRIQYPFADDKQNSCKKIGGGDSGSFIVPLASSFGNATIEWGAAVRPYKGPGTFERTTSPSSRHP